MFGFPSLIEAAENGELDFVRRKVEKGADINQRGFLKMTALMGAAAYGHENVVSYLLEQPQTDLDTLNAGGTTALMAAARNGHLGTVKILLNDPRCDVNKLGKWGGTALMNAAGFGHIEIVKELLKINNISLAPSYTDKQYSPITIAKQNGHDDIANLLEDFEKTRTPTTKPKHPKPPGR